LLLTVLEMNPYITDPQDILRLVRNALLNFYTLQVSSPFHSNKKHFLNEEINSVLLCITYRPLCYFFSTERSPCQKHKWTYHCCK